jgi:Putative redox-active protein (C_GCAxxG_C_C)
MSVENFPNLPTPKLRKRSLGNLLRMGHCAPTVMQTMLDASDAESTWLVTLTAGLPGGIGNTGGECGGVTAPLVLMGLRRGRHDMVDGPPCRGGPRPRLAASFHLRARHDRLPGHPRRLTAATRMHRRGATITRAVCPEPGLQWHRRHPERDAPRIPRALRPLGRPRVPLRGCRL